MRVMGVDPGLTRCGLSVVETGAGRKVTALDVDVVRTPTDMELADRLLAGAKGHGENDFKIPLARRTVIAVLTEATGGDAV